MLLLRHIEAYIYTYIRRVGNRELGRRATDRFVRPRGLGSLLWTHPLKPVDLTRGRQQRQRAQNGSRASFTLDVTTQSLRLALAEALKDNTSLQAASSRSS